MRFYRHLAAAALAVVVFALVGMRVLTDHNPPPPPPQPPHAGATK